MTLFNYSKIFKGVLFDNFSFGILDDAPEHDVTVVPLFNVLVSVEVVAQLRQEPQERVARPHVPLALDGRQRGLGGQALLEDEVAEDAARRPGQPGEAVHDKLGIFLKA